VLAAARVHNDPYFKMRFLYLKLIFKQNEKNMGWKGQTTSFAELLIFNCLSAERGDWYLKCFVLYSDVLF